MWGWLVSHLPWDNTAGNSLNQVSALWLWAVARHRFLWTFGIKWLKSRGAGSEPAGEGISVMMLTVCAVWCGRGHEGTWMPGRARVSGRVSQGDSRQNEPQSAQPTAKGFICGVSFSKLPYWLCAGFPPQENVVLLEKGFGCKLARVQQRCQGDHVLGAKLDY